MNRQLPNGIPIANHESVKAPFVAQYLPQQELVARGGYAIEIGKRSHQGRHASIDGRLERTQVNIAQLVFRNIRGRIITTTFDRAIACEVFCASRN